MELSTLDDLLRRDPFIPFRMKFSNGEHIDIRNPDLVVATKREIFIAADDRETVHIFSMLHAVGTETLANGSRKRRH